PARVRWLQGGTLGSLQWDAFEAPKGTSLYDHVRAPSRLSWAELRKILLGIAEEIEMRLQTNPSGSIEVSLRHIWVDPQGEPILLDFQAFVDDIGSMATHTVDAHTAKRFLHQILHFGMTGEAPPIDRLGTIPPPVPLPEHARVFAGRLCRPGMGFS